MNGGRKKSAVYLVLLITMCSCSSGRKNQTVLHDNHKLRPDTLITHIDKNIIFNKSGLYAFKIQTGNRPKNPLPEKNYKFEIAYKLKNKGQVIRESVLTELNSPWETKNAHGFILEWFHVPEELPKNTLLVIEYSVISDKLFIDEYGGNIDVGIWKLSDK